MPVWGHGSPTAAEPGDARASWRTNASDAISVATRTFVLSFVFSAREGADGPSSAATPVPTSFPLLDSLSPAAQVCDALGRMRRMVRPTNGHNGPKGLTSHPKGFGPR